MHNNIHLSCIDASGSCQARCGVYVEGGGPVPILSGVGLYVQDADDDRDFPMEVRADVLSLF